MRSKKSPPGGAYPADLAKVAGRQTSYGGRHAALASVTPPGTPRQATPVARNGRSTSAGGRSNGGLTHDSIHAKVGTDTADRLQSARPPAKAAAPGSVPLGPGDPPPYGDTQCGPAYWDARHAASGDEPYDWYMDCPRLLQVLRMRLPASETEPEILDVGCGTSELASCLWAEGWKNVIGIDTSSVAVTRARGALRHADRPELQFLQMDACKLDFPDNCFHVVIDKALFDTIITGGHAFPLGRAMLNEAYRVLRPGGIFFLVSLGDVASRLPWLSLEATWGWRIEVARLPRHLPICLKRESAHEYGAMSESFFVYICTKSRTQTDAD
eukprot:TRINITY_DN32086_c0_g1_i1.p1 TRINITY_DN32086_c0_g1~~TRINITY_DN32086_c0_g1_i1.p1  ORF type:complete len:327 (-),score=33.58 TRINITY_DN32086_c0_g1_i1:21-1001(-)